MLRALGILALLAAASVAQDRDRDGLSDYQERHKYGTDPEKRDSDGDGKPDGDWNERREYTYSIRTVVRVMPPYNKKALADDDYQDVRVRKETRKYIELEVVHYPLNTHADAIEGRRGWRKAYARMREHLAPGVTTNWDKGMRRALLAELDAAGIQPDRLTDKEVVERVSRWLLQRGKFVNMFCTYYVHFPQGRARILPGCEKRFEDDKGDRAWSVDEQLQRELFGKGMFENRTHGTCTSTAVYLTTVLRAVGIPTRMVVGIPFVDASDEKQLAMVESGVTHHGLRSRIYPALAGAGSSFAAHTYNEVFVGDRWRRLNYSKLGANTTSTFGLMTHVHRFNDLSEARLAETWGKRYAKRERDEVFSGSNPYTTLELSDLFGPHAAIPNPEDAAREHKHLTVSKVYWWFSDDRPDWIKAERVPERNAGAHVLIHVDEWFEDLNYTQIKTFMRRADKEFRLEAKGRPPLRARLSMGYYTFAKTGHREIHLVIPNEDFAKMAKGVPYTLHPARPDAKWQWRVKKGVTLTRE